MKRLQWFIVLASLVVRLAVSFGPHSGESTPPKYGDYEAQRHWMEITVNLPIQEWYRNSTHNDVLYWGLDYPPLSGYQSWLHGRFIKKFEPNAVELFDSRGYETQSSKLLLRWTVIWTDLFVLFPAAIWLSSSPQLLALLLLQPCLLLIDHGHFQYNNISLGLVLASVCCLNTNRHTIASILYISSVNHKHMSLYFAPAFFSYLLGRCLEKQRIVDKIIKFCSLGGTVIGTMYVIWLPFLSSVETVVEVIQALTPVDRGIYEDYVSNFWCSTSVFIKWKQLFTKSTLVPLCFLATIAASLPSMVHQIRTPSLIGFLYSLVNSSLAFYLFAYQVHEKSILLPALAMCLLLEHEPFLCQCFQVVATFSMFPLFEKDGLHLQYYATTMILLSIPLPLRNSVQEKRISLLLMFVCSGLHLFRASFVPPVQYPFLHDLLFATFSFSFFLSTAIYLNHRQWEL